MWEDAALTYHASPATIMSNGFSSHDLKLNISNPLSKTAYRASMRWSVGTASADRAWTVYQNSCTKVIEMATTMDAFVRNAKAVPIAMLICCREISKAKCASSDTGVPCKDR